MALCSCRSTSHALSSVNVSHRRPAMHVQLADVSSWRWIFILEGLATAIVAVASFWWLYDYPGTAKFLSEPERALVTE